MTTLYRPVRIESAEQAEALPIGTIATTPPGEEWPMAYMRSDGDAPPWYASTDGDSYVYHDEMVGCVALVPIEAEEEYGGGCPCGIKGCVSPGADPEYATHRRYETHWETA